MARPPAVVIGAGIGGLAAAAGLHAAGWDVTVCERAVAVEPAGAGLGWPRTACGRSTRSVRARRPGRMPFRRKWASGLRAGGGCCAATGA
jgi:glycine/D-amino acid oxidase-like deaminating enzyme